MVKLDARNVLLKPTHRRQVITSLRRAVRVGERLGDFDMKLSMQRIGNSYEMRAAVHDAIGDFGCRAKQRDIRHAARDLARTVNTRLHEQALRQT